MLVLGQVRITVTIMVQACFIFIGGQYMYCTVPPVPHTGKGSEGVACGHPVIMALLGILQPAPHINK